MSLETPVQASIKPTVVGHRITRLKSETTARHVAEVDSVAESVGETSAFGTASIDVSGFGSGEMSVEHLSADMGWMSMPAVLSTSSGLNSQESSSHAESSSTSYATTHAETRGKALMVGQSTAQGSSEAFEPIYKELPGSFHSLEHELYFAAQKLRQLADGEAYLHFVGKGRTPAVYAKITVPLVGKQVVSNDAYVRIRAKVLDASPSARPIAEAMVHMENRKRSLGLKEDKPTSPQAEITEPESFRVPAPKSLKGKVKRRSRAKT